MAPSAARCFPKAPRDRSSRGGGHGGTEERSCIESLGVAMVDPKKLEGYTNTKSYGRVYLLLGSPPAR